MDNIKDIGVRFKKPTTGNEDKFLTLVSPYKGCIEHKYVIDEEGDVVTCSNCDKTFNPMSVLVKLSRKESRWMMNMQRYNEDMKRLSERCRTKCQHCKQMTKISKT